MSSSRDLDIEAILADAPPKADLKPSFKTCVRIDVWRANFEQLQAELLRLDELLLSQRNTKNRAEATYRCKRYNNDLDFREKEKARKKQSKARLSCVQTGQNVS